MILKNNIQVWTRNGMRRQLPATWTAKQERLALLLASGKGIKAAASEIEVGERTAHTWLDDICFRNLISDLRSRLLDAAVGRLVESTNDAVSTLVDLLSSERETVRLRAALGIVDSMIRLREHVDFDRRLLELESSRATGFEDEGDAA
jgi:hypothetical protein